MRFFVKGGSPHLAQWPREDTRRAELIAARPATADDVAAWVKDVHGQNGQHGRRGQGKLEPKSIQSIVSTKSTYAEISANGGAGASRRGVQPA